MLEGFTQLNRPYRIIAFDWDGTAVENRSADARPISLLIEKLLKLSVPIVVITGTNFNNINKQLSSLIMGPHKRRLYILTNRGSEVYGFAENSEPVLIYRRKASVAEDLLLTKVAQAVRDYSRYRGGPKIDIVYNRLNRRKVDMIPEPEWADPPKSRIGELLQATEHRLRNGGISGGIKQLFELAEKLSPEFGLESARLTSDVKFIEVGLTDKADSVRWVLGHLAQQVEARPEDILLAGDEFGPIAGFEGSDFRMVIPEAKGSVFVSVGPEPAGVPPEVLHIGGGPARFERLLEEQIDLHAARH
jgi:hydroxymethylpyrimidine pyrophosphatase-like HAD family hydrolase